MAPGPKLVHTASSGFVYDAVMRTDAPVTVVITDSADESAKEASLQSRLRGWKVTTDSPQEVLSSL